MKLQRAKLVVVLMTVLGFAALLALALFLFSPTYKDVRRLTDEITRSQAELEAQYENRKNLLSQHAKIAAAQATMQTLATQFVRTGRELDLITAVEELAVKDGVTERLQLSENGGTGRAPELAENFDLMIDGSYHDVMQMLVDLEKLPTLLLVETIAVHPGGSLVPGGPVFLSIALHGTVAAPPKGL